MVKLLLYILLQLETSEAQAQLDLLVRLEKLDQLDLPDQQGLRVSKDQLDLLVHKDHRANRVFKVFKAFKETLVQLDLRVLKVTWETLVRQDRLVPREILDLLAQRVRKDLKVLKVPKVTQDPLDHKETLDRLGLRETSVLLDLQDQQALKVSILFQIRLR
jgi:hypothetical protein